MNWKASWVAFWMEVLSYKMRLPFISTVPVGGLDEEHPSPALGPASGWKIQM